MTECHTGEEMDLIKSAHPHYSCMKLAMWVLLWLLQEQGCPKSQVLCTLIAICLQLIYSSTHQFQVIFTGAALTEKKGGIDVIPVSEVLAR